ncbi:MAG: cell division protein FtsQ/DivIB [Capnocytophaga sp.]|nr:cell division protein FtsQ/DivIB [Capnocytophaga sp.]
MSRLKKIGKLLVIVLLPILLQAFASRRNDARAVKELRVRYIGTENMYITDETIRKLLFKRDRQEYLYEVNLHELEDLLNAHVMVERSEVFHTIDGTVEAQVKQREPIGRINEQGKFYYMDSQGKQMPLSATYSARVPLISGAVGKENWETTYELLKYIRNDDFLTKNVTEIIVKNNGDYNIKMRVADFVVILGDLENLDTKKANLKAFYKKAEKSKLLNVYKTVNLKYSNQVICIRN